MTGTFRPLMSYAPVVVLLSLSTTGFAHGLRNRRGYYSIVRQIREIGSRGYNSDPYEVNVEGRDNLFSRDDECSPDINGMFGSDDGNQVSLEFYYQMETLPLDNAEQQTREILNKVETSVSKTLLPSLFRDTCALTARSRISNQEPHRQLTEMNGIT
ncbi:MAG: hypothetical protein AAF581_23150, partial [Planctomycetota bacterium]